MQDSKDQLVLRDRPDNLDQPDRRVLKERLDCRGLRGPRACVVRLDRLDLREMPAPKA